jgi:hypothetical protein
MAISPVKQWKITCKGSNTDRLTLETFFDTVGGNSLPFYFTDENGSTQTLRFADKTLSISTIYREFDLTSLTHGTPVGFTAEISVKTAL